LAALATFEFSAPYQQYALSLTLIATKNTGNVNEEARYIDALTIAEVTEILRWADRG